MVLVLLKDSFFSNSACYVTHNCTATLTGLSASHSLQGQSHEYSLRKRSLQCVVDIDWVNSHASL